MKPIVRLAREVLKSGYINDGAPGWKGGPDRAVDLCEAIIRDFNAASAARHGAFIVMLGHFNVWCRRNNIEEVQVPREYTKWLTRRNRVSYER